MGVVPVREGVWSFQAVGALAVDVDGVAVEVGGGRQRRLLAVLLIHRGAMVSADRAAEAVFAGEPTPGAATTLRSYVSRLRKVLPADVDGGGSVVATVPGGWVLSIPDDWFDVAVFEQGVATGRSLLDTGDAAAAVGVLRAAVGLWRGPPYEEFADEHWAMGEVQRLEELRRVALEAVIDAELACGRARGVVAELEGLVGEFPLAEGFRRRLMVALYRCGRQADALSVFQRYRAVLVDELGLEPSPELAELERQILDHDPALAAESEGVSVRGYRLGDRLGRGRDGVVHAATLAGVDRDLAIRVYDATLADDVGFVRRFEDQAKRLASLHHEAVVAVQDWWREPAAAYLVMRRLHGGTLRDRLDQGRLDEAELAALVARVGNAVAAAARVGVGHGRLGVDSVMFEDGAAVVTDFALGQAEPAVAGRDVTALAELVVACLTGEPHVDATATARLPATVAELVAAGLDPTSASTLEVDDYAASLHTALTGTAAAAAQAPRLNPFKGLRAFDEIDAGEFFGRERVVDGLLTRVGRTDTAGRLALVVGGSGSGKSSVVRAGLLPRLRQGDVAGSEGWLVTTMLPGASPFKEFAEAVRRVAVHTDDTLLDEFVADGTGIDTVLRQVLPEHVELLVVIDQFEELFTLTHLSQRQRFLDALANAVTAEDGRLRVVATLRADFYDRPLDHPRLGPLVQPATVTVPAMTASELEAAITGPAQRAGLTIETGLVTELVAAVIEQPAALPALQFTLYELTEQATEATLTLDGYRVLGGVEGAVAGRAEHLYRSLDDRERAVIRRGFDHLVTITDETEPIRRRALRTDLTRDGDGDGSVLEAWVQARLLTVGRDPESRAPTIEVAHEALLHQWPRLRDWIIHDRDTITALAHLRDTTRTWTDHDRDPDLLYRGFRLDHACVITATRPGAIAPIEREFLDAGQAARDDAEREQAEQVAGQARSNRRLKTLLGSVAIALVAALIAALVAVDQRSTADDATDRAGINARDADTARMVATVESLAGQDQRAALLLAAEAYDRDPSPTSRGALQRALTARTGFLGYIGIDYGRATSESGFYEGIANAGFTSDGQIVLATATTIRIFDPTGRTLLRTIAHDIGPGRRANALAVAQDQPLVAIRDDTGVNVFDIDTGEHVASFSPPAGPTGIWFSPGGELLVATRAGGVTTFSLDGTPSGELATKHAVDDVAFSSDGTILVTASGNRDPQGFRIWDYRTRTELPRAEPSVFEGEPLGAPRVTRFGPRAVAFSADDRYLAAGYTDGHVVIWDTDTWTIHRQARSGEPALLYEPGSIVFDVEIVDTSPLRVVAMGFSTISHWNLSEGFEEAIAREPTAPTATRRVQATRGMAVDHRRGLLLTATESVELWSTDDRGLIAEPIGRPSWNELSSSSDGSFLIRQGTAPGRIGEIYKRDLRSGEETLVVDDALWGATMSPDDSILITAGPVDGDLRRNQLRQWDPVTLDEIAAPIDVPCCFQLRRLSPDGRHLAIGYGALLDVVALPQTPSVGLIEIYEITERGLARTAEIAEFTEMRNEPLAVLEFNHDGSRLLANSGDVTAEWSVPDGRLLRDPDEIADTISGWPLGPTRTGPRQAWRPSPSTIALVDPDSLARVGAPFLGAEGNHESAVFAVDDSLMFTGWFNLGGGLVTMWDVESRTQLGGPLPNRGYLDATGVGVVPIVLPEDSPLGPRLVTTTPNQLLAWNLDFEAWPDIACAAAGRNLTLDEWERFGPDEPYQATCSQWP